MRNKKELIGLLECVDGWLWFAGGFPIGIEEFEGKLVKVTCTEGKIVIEIIKEVEPVLPKARELCTAGVQT